MTDPFQDAHKANARAAEQKAAKDIADKANADAKARLAEKQKPKFNDLPVYRSKDPLKWSLG